MKLAFIRSFTPRRKSPTPSSTALKNLVDGCKKGDEDAWVTLFKKYVNYVRKIVSSPSWDFRRSVQEELVQEVFLKLITNRLGSLKKPSALNSFIAKTAQNVCISELRKSVFLENPGVDCLADPHTADPESRAIQKEQWELIDRAIREISERCQKLIRFYYGEEKTYREIGEALGISISNVGVSFSRCLKQLKTNYLKKTGKIS